MKKVKVFIEFEEEKLDALRFYSTKKEVNIEGELTDAIEKLYEKYVPQATREYIESRIQTKEKAVLPTKKPVIGVGKVEG